MKVLQNTVARPVTGVSFGPNGDTLMAGGSGGFEVWDVAVGTNVFVPSHSVQALYGFAHDPLGRWVYVSDSVSGFRFLPTCGGGTRPGPIPPHFTDIRSFAVTPDGRRLVASRGAATMNRVECWAVCSDAAFAPLWSVRDGEPVDPAEPYAIGQATWFTYAVAVAPDGGLVATSESRPGLPGGPVVAVRDGATGREVATLGETWTNFRPWLAFTPDGGAVFAQGDRSLERWDVTAGRRTAEQAAPGRADFKASAVHPAGRFLLTASGDGQVRYWDAATLGPVRALKWGVGKLHSVAVSPDGSLAAAGGEKGRVVVWAVDE